MGGDGGGGSQSALLSGTLLIDIWEKLFIDIKYVAVAVTGLCSISTYIWD